MNSGKEQQFFRGDIVLFKFRLITDYTRHKERPALVIQNDIGNRYSRNVIVASISTKVPKKRYPTHLHISADDTEAGLEKDSIVQFENILTIPKRLAIQKLGVIPEKHLDLVDRCIKVSLGIAR